jgi:hypothetical protein
MSQDLAFLITQRTNKAANAGSKANPRLRIVLLKPMAGITSQSNNPMATVVMTAAK